MKKLLFMSAVFTASLFAQQEPPQGPPPGGEHRKPPFVTACEDKNVNDSCNYTERDGSTRNDKCVYSTSPRGEQELTCGTPPAPPQMRRPR
jgi:hypothetical protein